MPPGVETPVTVGGLIITSIFLLVVSFAPRIYDWIQLRYQHRAQEAQARREADAKAAQAEDAKDEQAWDRVLKEYERALDRNTRLEKELEALRPLALQNAVLEQKMMQCREDKEDWKTHSISLEEQLAANNIIPRPFRRLPRSEENTDKLKTISQKMQAIKMDAGVSAAKESPTLVFPKEGE